MRFGIDDYLLSPQWYHDDYPYLAAIPRQPGDAESSPYACMWHTPTIADDFTLVDAHDAHRQPGYVHKRLESDLAKLKSDIVEETNRVLDGLPGEDLSIAAALTVVRHAWMILTDNAATFDEKRLEFAEFQRAWLELRGMLDYRGWKQACYRNTSQLQSTPTRDCVGCFVESLPVAMTLFDMGIPIWLVREKTSVLRGNIYIQEAAAHTTPPDLRSPPICVDRDDSFPIIYDSSPRDKKHYLSQHTFARIRSIVYDRSGSGQPVYRAIDRDQMGCRNAATVLVELQTIRAQGAPASQASSGASSSSSSSAAPSASSSRRGKQGPRKSFPSSNLNVWSNLSPDKLYAGARMAKGKAPVLDSIYQAAVTKYSEQTGFDEPYAIGAWSYAFTQLDTRRLKTESNPPAQVYTFPPASLFAQTNPLRQQQYYCSWLHIRRMWKNQMRSSTGRVLALKAQTWKDILRFGLGGPSGPHTNVEGRNMLQIQEDFAKVNLNVSSNGRVITFDNGEQLLARSSRVSGAADVHLVSWKDLDFNVGVEEIPGFIKREILWELHELNFRFDLIRLDEAMFEGQEDAAIHQDRLWRCWGTPHDFFYDPVDIEWPKRDIGLASHALRHRLPFLRSMHALCATWRGFPMPHGMDDISRHGLDSRDLETLEMTLCSAIEQTFYDLFKRPMVPPRRLFLHDQ